MKVGIIVHSFSGNTLAVAQELREELISLGHSVNLEQVTAFNEEPSAARNIQLKTIPNIYGYDALIFGAPVRGFSLSPVMKSYLSQIPSLKGKKVSCFVTQFFPFTWMGGNRTISQIKEVCELKDVNVLQTGIVNWSHRERDKKITEVVKKLSKL